MSTTMDIDAVIAESDREFPALYQFFGGYFHEDWREDHDTPDVAVRAFLAEAPPEAVDAARAELDRLLASGFDDAALTRLLAGGFASDYVPATDGVTTSDWLSHVGDLLDR
jgi:CdiI immunity protein